MFGRGSIITSLVPCPILANRTNPVPRPFWRRCEPACEIERMHQKALEPTPWTSTQRHLRSGAAAALCPTDPRQ
jgi:hypothetical protein